MKYEYEPLAPLEATRAHQNIRLLELLPLANGEKIQCHLRRVSLDDDLAYEAVSYCWGSPQDTVDVKIDQATVSITRNLHNALRTFRRETEQRILWADALCINQADLREKEHQVPLMRQIYQRCQRVLIWLGESTSDTKGAMTLMRTLNRIGVEHDMKFPPVRSFNMRTIQELGVPSLLDYSHAKLMEFTKLSWFSRAWIVQEAVLPPVQQLYWGHEAVDWVDFARAMDVGQSLMLPFAGHPAFSYLATILTTWHNAASPDHHRPFLDILVSHQVAHAGVARDKVFAFLGLVDPTEAKKLNIEVKYDGPLAPILENVARQIATHERSLRILSVKAFLPASNEKDIPSWAPDWSAKSTTSPRLFQGISLVNTIYFKDMLQPFNASAGSNHVATAPSSPKTLTVEGFVVDQVKHVGSVFPGYPFPSTVGAAFRFVKSYTQTWQILPEWEDAATDRGEATYRTGEDMRDAFWKTICCNKILTSEAISQVRQEYLEFIEGHRRFASTVRTPVVGLVAFIVLAMWGLIKVVILRWPLPSFQHRCGAIVDRRFVLTRKGYMGVASQSTQVDDCVALFKGSTIPLVIRQMETSWTFIGDAYVHGMMNGEAFEEGQCHKMDIK